MWSTGCCRANARAAAHRGSSSSRSAPRLIPTRDDRPPTRLSATSGFELAPLSAAHPRPRRVVLAGLVALALLALGEAAPAAFPVLVSIEGHSSFIKVTVDGQAHTLSSVIGPGWRGVRFEQPGPLEREYQIDGSDTTS